VSIPFNPGGRLIVVRGDVAGPTDTAVFRLVLDAGSTRTVLDRGLSSSIGLVPDPSHSLVTMTAVTGIVHIPKVQVTKLVAMEQERNRFTVLLHDLPAMRFDGVLGIDFLRGQELAIDFRQGLIALT